MGWLEVFTKKTSFYNDWMKRAIKATDITKTDKNGAYLLPKGFKEELENEYKKIEEEDKNNNNK